MILTELDRSLHWDAVGLQEITTNTTDETPRTWQTHSGHRVHLGSKLAGGVAVATAIHKRWARYVYHIHFATRSCTVTLRVPTGRFSDDTTSLKLTTMHAPSPLNHTHEELDVSWHEVAENLKGKRCIRVLMVDANCDLGRACEHDDDDDGSANEATTTTTRNDDRDTDTTQQQQHHHTQRDETKRNRRKATYAMNEKARTTWMHVKGMTLRPCSATSAWWNTCRRHY